jgi:hypothetical protein
MDSHQNRLTRYLPVPSCRYATVHDTCGPNSVSPGQVGSLRIRSWDARRDGEIMKLFRTMTAEFFDLSVMDFAWRKVWAGGVLSVLLFSGITWAQVNTGTISGTVKDSSGAVLPGSKIVILNEDTGISRTLEADANGLYTAPALELGHYRVTVTRDGFQTEIRTGIVLTVAREEVVNLSLTVGSMAQKVEVTGAAPLVESTTASLGSLVDDQTIRDLPLNGRSYDQLTLLQPGVTLTSPGTPSGTVFNYGTSKRFSVGGQRPNANLFLLDGTDVNDQANGTPGGASGSDLGVDTILEFKVFTNSWGAEYGHSSGSVTTVVTRSGTNAFHGTVFEYIRNHVLDARNYFDAASGPPPFIRNNFGGVLGGPIKKDKTFFFIGYEGLRQGLGTTLIATVPTALARQGILPSGNVTVNPIVVPYLNLYPLPNGRDFGNGTAQFISSPTIVTNQDNGMGRVDHQLNANNSIFGRYWFDGDDVNAPQSVPGAISVLSSRRQDATVQWNSILSANTLNNFRFAYNQTTSFGNYTYTPGYGAGLSFVPGVPLGTIQLGASGASVSGSTAITTIGGTNGAGPTTIGFGIFEWGDDVSYNRGKHSFKVGTDIQRIRHDYRTSGSQRGSYTFASLNTFLAGTPSNFQVTSPIGLPVDEGIRQTIPAFYAQDDYKVNSRLTLNLGLRWEAATNPVDSEGRTSILPSLTSTSTVPWPYEISISKMNFEPRVGLAWQITNDGKTVLRAGAGVYHDEILSWAFDALTKNPPFSGIFSATNPPFPNAVSLFSGLTPGSSTGLIALAISDPFLKTPTSYQYNLSLQREIAKNTMIQVAYAGSHSDHELTEIEADTPTPTICSTSLDNCPAGVANGAYYYPAGAKRRNPAWAGIRYYRTNGDSEYDSATITLRHQSSNGFVGQIYYTFSKALDDSSGVSPGESMRSPQAQLNPDLPPTSNWSLSDFDSKHTLVGYASYPLPFRADSKALGTIVNGWKLDGILTAASGLPFTALLGSNVSRNLSTAGLSDRPNLNPGFSDNPTSGVSAGCPGFAAGTRVGTPQNWFDPCAFSSPIAGTYGDLGRNTLIGPGVTDLDFALEKNFPLTERLNATFRAEAFNILNHANFGLPSVTAITASGAANPAAGNVTFTTTSSRQLQFALRINF